MGGTRPGAGSPHLSRTQCQARLKDRGSLERGRRPAILYLRRRARTHPRALKALLTIACEESNPLEVRTRIWMELYRSSGDALQEILDRAGAPKIKALELRAFDDIGREVERELEREERPVRRDVTPEMLDEANQLIGQAMALLAEKRQDGKRAPLVYVRRGSSAPIEVPYEPVNGKAGEQAH